MLQNACSSLFYLQEQINNAGHFFYFSKKKKNYGESAILYYFVNFHHNFISQWKIIFLHGERTSLVCI